MNRSQFEDRSEKIPMAGCWIWNRDIRAQYGSLWFCGKTEFAHRVAYQLYKGDIPAGLHVLHKCDVKLCVNPDHLYIGTAKQNAEDYLTRRDPSDKRAPRGPGRYPSTQCTYGHLLTEDNILWRSSGGRACRTCNRDRIAAWKLGLTLEKFYDWKSRLL